MSQLARGDWLRLFALLTLMGAGWGLTIPLTKVMVSEGYGHFGLIFWQSVIGAAVLGLIVRLRGKRLLWSGSSIKTYVIIALIGTILPNSASFQAAAHLPAGIISMALSLIPMMAFPIAVLLGLDQFNLRRLTGLALGLTAVAMIVLPDTALPDPAMVWWVPVALIAPMFYACEGNYVARWGTAGMGPIETLAGASIVAMLISFPLALATDQFIDPRGPWGAPDAALVAASLIHAAVYSAYVWMVGRAGPTFAAQVSYLVTGFGVLWAMALLGERYALIVWAALALMFAGMALVQPRDPKDLGKPARTSDAGSPTS